MLDLKRDPLQAYLDAQRDHGDVVRFSAGPPGARIPITVMVAGIVMALVLRGVSVVLAHDKRGVQPSASAPLPKFVIHRGIL